MKFTAAEVAPELKIPFGFAICPCCNGRGKTLLSEKERAKSYNRGKTEEECTNCGGQKMFGAGKGYSKIDPSTGLGCLHKFSSKNTGRCLTQYTCSACQEIYVIDSGD